MNENSSQGNAHADSSDNSLQITCFSDFVDDVTLHFQIIRFPNQIYAWIGCNSAKFGRLYAAAPTPPNNTVSVSSILGGVSDNTGSGIARRLVLKTGLNVILACNIPKNSPMLEVNAEKKLVGKLISLGYTRPKYS
ncbi:proteasome assembly chaperone 4 [Mangifera indica]|uniref:proteasome assembly chaperone 4 n=1 Tax=Mangifera indica TaxID=29780 RepID=UPI001CFA3DD1|nr:proteasome assembly chaperone 4 [Mangifera indica]